MSLWGVHMGFAGLVTAIVVARTDSSRPWRWTMIFLSCIWAIVPDLFHFVPGIRSWYKPLIHDSLLSNLFWLHGLIDWLDPGDSIGYSIAMWIAFLVVFVTMELRVRRE